MRYNVKTIRIGLEVQEAPEHGAGSDKEATEILRAIYADLDADKEHFTVLALSNKCRVSGFKTVSTGTMTSSLIHPREVFRAAIMLGAVSVIVAHNHPSGDPAPSDEDVQVTKRLSDAGRLLGITVLDHIILGKGTHYSFKRAGGVM